METRVQKGKGLSVLSGRVPCASSRTRRHRTHTQNNAFLSPLLLFPSVSIPHLRPAPVLSPTRAQTLQAHAVVLPNWSQDPLHTTRICRRHPQYSIHTSPHPTPITILLFTSFKDSLTSHTTRHVPCIFYRKLTTSPIQEITPCYLLLDT